MSGLDGAARAGRRSWWATAVAVLLVALYLVWWLTFTRMHLPPTRFVQRPPGATATSQGAEFRLVSLQQTEQLSDGDEPVAAAAEAVWVVARFTVTVRAAEAVRSCAVRLVGPEGRTWEKPAAYLSRETPDCVPRDAAVGAVFPVETFFEVPRADVAGLRGVAVTRYDAGTESVLVPGS
ncbi:MAG: hypothetical protein JWP61_2123 [Friedmanniella sp.]|nr:hypothetical protein [Friedmanniella sp.]